MPPTTNALSRRPHTTWHTIAVARADNGFILQITGRSNMVGVGELTRQTVHPTADDLLAAVRAWAEG